MPQPTLKTLAACLLAGTVTLLVGGCATSYTSQLTPELQSYAASEEQGRNRQAKVLDNNGRQIWDDFARLMLLEESSQLTRYPVP